MLTIVETHKGFEITKAGKQFKVYKADGGAMTYTRYNSVDEAKQAINAYCAVSQQIAEAQQASAERHNTLSLNGNRGFQLMR